MPQPDAQSAPPNPFAGQQQAPAPQVEEAQVVQQQAPAPTTAPEAAPVKDTGWAEPTNQQTPPTPATPDGIYVPFSTMIPADKMDKVLAAIGRALK